MAAYVNEACGMSALTLESERVKESGRFIDDRRSSVKRRGDTREQDRESAVGCPRGRGSARRRQGSRCFIRDHFFAVLDEPF